MLTEISFQPIGRQRLVQMQKEKLKKKKKKYNNTENEKVTSKK